MRSSLQEHDGEKTEESAETMIDHLLAQSRRKTDAARGVLPDKGNPAPVRVALPLREVFTVFVDGRGCLGRSHDDDA